MTLSRKEYMKKLGYQEPFDSSPVEVPDGWSGGEVINTGGGIFCRIWRTWEPGKRGRDTEYEIIFDVSQGEGGVAVQSYTWVEHSEEYMFDEIIKTPIAEDGSDRGRSELARQLMEEYPK